MGYIKKLVGMSVAAVVVLGIVSGIITVSVTAMSMPRVPVTVVYSGHGFALNGDEFHVLRVQVIKVREPKPREIMGYIGANMSLKELKAAIAKERPRYRGRLRVGDELYRLDNITTGNRTVSADLMNVSGLTRERAGHISITVMRYEGTRIGEGTLSIYKGAYIGEYRVLLAVLPPHPVKRRI